MKTLPNKLRIKDGKLFCLDGDSVEEYLKEWCAKKKVDEHTPLSILKRQDLQSIKDWASIAYNWGA